MAAAHDLMARIDAAIRDGADPRRIPRSWTLIVDGKPVVFSEPPDPFFQGIKATASKLRATGVIHVNPAKVTVSETGSDSGDRILICLVVLHHVGLPHRKAWIRGSHDGSEIPWTEVEHEMLPSDVPFLFGN